VSSSSARPGQLWWLAAGFAVWCSSLAVLYAMQAIGCAFAWSTLPLRLSLGAVFLLHLAVIAWMWRSRDADTGFGFDPTEAFLRRAIVWTTAAAFITTIVTLGPPLLLTVCM
jgi:hypothetical protein